MKESVIPRRPVTPFFLFMQAERTKVPNLPGKEAGERWQQLPKKEKLQYVEQYKRDKTEYENYLKDVYGMSLAPSLHPTKTVPAFTTTRIRAVLGQDRKIKPMASEIYGALAPILVRRWTRFRNGLWKKSAKRP